ncbi:MFS transporter [Alkalihalobacillus sp. 1P02AB]|uniref:MFS transporter n=1 Tax=Alkalihalobacillus sp. 1P02AB TaxID=3132260 RepID=UPI0039A77551
MKVKSTFASHPRYSLMTFILFWCGLIILSSMYITIPLLSMFSSLFSIPLKQAAWLGSAFAFCYALGCLIYGPFSDRFGRKIFLVVSLSLLALVTFITGFVDHFYTLVALRALQGLIAAAFAPISLVYAGEMFPREKRVMVIGYISLGFFMAAIIGQVFSGLIDQLFNWNTLFFILGILYFLTTLMVIRFLPQEPPPEQKENILLKFKKMFALLKKKQLLLAFPITFMVLFSLVGLYTILGHYVSDIYGLNTDDILMIRGIGIVGMLISPFAGQLAKRFGMLTVLRTGLICAIVGIVCVGFSPSLSFMVLMTILFVFGLSLVNPINISLISELSGAARGGALSFNAFILFLGASSAPFVAIRILEVGQYQIAFLLLALLLSLSLLSSLFIQNKEQESSLSEMKIDA